jgi:hypothetical protein
MNSVTRRPSVLPSAAPDIPTLDQLYEMTSEPEHRVVIQNVDWAFYERLVDSIPEGANLHVTYDGGDLELMGNGSKHETIREPGAGRAGSAVGSLSGSVGPWSRSDKTVRASSSAGGLDATSQIP